MNSKYKGIFLIILAVAIFIAIIIVAVKMPIQNSCVDHENTIPTLKEELDEAKNISAGSKNNIEETVCQKAEFFLDTFYNSENQQQAIKDLMTDEAFQKLYAETPHGDSAGASDYSVTFSELHSYYKKIDETTADVLILADMSVNFSSGSTTAPLLFQVEMTYNKDWLVSEILQNSMVNIVY